MKSSAIHTWLLALLALLGAASCTNDLPRAELNLPPQLIVNGVFAADDSVKAVHFYLTGPAHPKPVQQATVEVYVNGQLRETVEATSPTDSTQIPGYWALVSTKSAYLKSQFRPGDEVRLKVSANAGAYRAEAVCQVPKVAGQIAAVDTTSVLERSRYNEYPETMHYTLHLHDVRGEDNFYRFVFADTAHKGWTETLVNGEKTTYWKNEPTVYRQYDAKGEILLTEGRSESETNPLDGIVMTFPNRSAVFSDALFRDGSYPLKISAPRRAMLRGRPFMYDIEKSRVSFRLLTLPKTYYYYLRALNTLYDGEELESIGEPVKLPSNVEGGTGILGIYITHEVVLPIGFAVYRE